MLLSFSVPSHYTVGIDPQAVVTGDFNGDSKVDIAVANTGSNSVSVMLNNGDGTFAAAQNAATGSNPRSLAAGDFNADGKLDLATANTGSGDVSVLMGNGDGTFGAAQSIPFPADAIAPGTTAVDPPLSVAVGDLNADGKMDLAVTSNLARSVYHQVPPNCYSYWGYWYCRYYGGYYTTEYSGYANVLLGNGDGGFSAPQAHSLTGISPYSVALGDVNGDGKLDVVTALADVNRVGVLLGNGDGTLLPVRDFGAGARPMSVAVGDVNGDSKLDVVTANSDSDNASVLLGNGDGTFQPAAHYGISQTTSNYCVGSRPQSVALSDFNGDGELDIVTANSGVTSICNGSVSVLLGNGKGSFTPALHVTSGWGYTAVAVGDFNADTLEDVAAANWGLSSASVLVNDGNWPVPVDVRINDVVLIETNSGTTTANFSVTLSADPRQTVTVHYSTADGTATTLDNDYQAKTGTLTFDPGGPLTQNVAIVVNGDSRGEPDETFFVNLTDANAFLTDSQGMATIRNDEPVITINDVSLKEGRSGTTKKFEFTVRLSPASGATVTVNFASADGSAKTADNDYVALTPGTLRFAPGVTKKTITVKVNGDKKAEPDETFFVNLSNPTNASIADSQGTGTIRNDDGTPPPPPGARISISDVGIFEGNDSVWHSAEFTVTLSEASSQTVSVNFTMADGTATVANYDYGAYSGTLSFAPGETSKTIFASVFGDWEPEGDEWFFVNLSSPMNASIADGSGVCTILDDEGHL